MCWLRFRGSGEKFQTSSHGASAAVLETIHATRVPAVSLEGQLWVLVLENSSEISHGKRSTMRFKETMLWRETIRGWVLS